MAKLEFQLSDDLTSTTQKIFFFNNNNYKPEKQHFNPKVHFQKAVIQTKTTFV